LRTRLKVLSWRKAVLAADAVFGLFLLIVGLAGSSSLSASTGMGVSRASTPVEIASRLDEPTGSVDRSGGRS
jgi:hypothetical protein